MFQWELPVKRKSIVQNGSKWMNDWVTYNITMREYECERKWQGVEKVVWKNWTMRCTIPEDDVYELHLNCGSEEDQESKECCEIKLK